MSHSILLVDDNYLCLEGIRCSIDWNALGISQVDCAYDGQTALDFLKNHDVDLVVSDISMPGLSGLELSEQALAIHSSIKIILISAYDKFEYAKQAVRLGAFDYIEKPLDYDYLTKILQKALEELAQEQQNLKILNKSRPAMEEQFFRSLISAGFHDEADFLSLYAGYLELPLDCRYSMVILVTIENAGTLRQKLGVQEYSVRLMSLEAALRDAMSRFSLHYLLKELDGYLCILGDREFSYEDLKKNAVSAFSEVAGQFSGRFDMIAGLGKIVSGLYELPSSCEQARKALEYRFFFPSRQILEAGSIAYTDTRLLIGQDEKEEALIHLISRNDMDGIRKWINHFADTFSGSCDSRNPVFIRLYSVTARILKFTYEMNLSNEEMLAESADVFSHPEKLSTIDAVCDWLYGICERISISLQHSVADYHQTLCDNAAAYISKNYTDSKLDLNQIAEHVQITPAYLSSLFKKYKGENLSSYLTDVRIDAACQLLQNTALPLKAISDKVGYSNQYYFSACFKKKTGMTPSAYRENKR